MKTYTCRRCRGDIPAYIHRELPIRRRRRVHLHLNGCAACYAYYRHLRDVDDELRATMPVIGVPDALQLARVWRGIQAEMRPARPAYGHWRMRYSLALAMMVLAIVLPWRFAAQQARALPVPPTPQTQTEVTEAIVRHVAMATPEAGPSLASYAPSLRSDRFATPAIVRNDAPTTIATDTP